MKSTLSLLTLGFLAASVSADVQTVHLTFHGGPAEYSLTFPADGEIYPTSKLHLIPLFLLQSKTTSILIMTAPFWEQKRQRHLREHHRCPRLQRPSAVHLLHGRSKDRGGRHHVRGAPAGPRGPAAAHYWSELPGHVRGHLRRLLRHQWPVCRALLQWLLRCG